MVYKGNVYNTETLFKNFEVFGLELSDIVTMIVYNFGISTNENVPFLKISNLCKFYKDNAEIGQHSYWISPL